MFSLDVPFLHNLWNFQLRYRQGNWNSCPGKVGELSGNIVLSCWWEPCQTNVKSLITPVLFYERKFCFLVESYEAHSKTDFHWQEIRLGCPKLLVCGLWSYYWMGKLWEPKPLNIVAFRRLHIPFIDVDLLNHIMRKPYAVWDHLSHIMRKPVDAICEQLRCRSACASVQADQHLHCSLPR